MNNLEFKNTLEKIDNKSSKIGVIGLGYVGLPLSILLVKNNFHIFGFDTDKKKISKIKKNKSYIDRISNSDVALINKKGKFYSNFSKIKECEIIIICVPTPLKNNTEPDLSFIRNTIKSIKKIFKRRSGVNIGKH